MAASAASLAQASPSRSAPTRDPPAALALSTVITIALGALLLRGRASLAATILVEWQLLIFWAVVVGFLSFFPIVTQENARLTMDEPILLTLALLYPPEVAALVALLAGVDIREIKGEVSFSRAWFNRVQIGLSIYIAGAAFRMVTNGQLDPWPVAVIGTGAAVTAEFLANVLLVSLHARALFRLEFRAAVRRLRVGGVGQFLATHLGYGSLSLVLAHLFLSVGAWSVATFLVPIFVARQMLIRGQEIEALAEEVRDRDRLLKKISDRMLDERRDERLRVAGDLHDETLQELTEIWLLSQLIEKKGVPAGSIGEDIGRLILTSQASIESLRTMIHDLRELPLGRTGLIPTIDGLVRNARLEWKARINLEASPSLEIAADSQVVIYQVAREALLNALKHARADSIWVRLFPESDQLVLEVEDDGIGFLPRVVDSAQHFGLELLRERVHLVGGHAEVQSQPGIGTKVTVIFPRRSG